VRRGDAAGLRGRAVAPALLDPATMARLAAIALLLAILGATSNAADDVVFLELPPDVLPSDVGGSAFR
jgi:hypothetical protein